MKLKELENWLSQCEPFDKPKALLEQYATSAHIAARMVYAAQEHMEGAAVCDLGSGCGVLSIGSVMVGAAYVCGLEVDPDATEIALKNSEEILDDGSTSSIDFIESQINVDFSEAESQRNCYRRFESVFDVIVMNPPFGTKKCQGADFGFLRTAAQFVKPGGHIYSLHKTSTRSFFERRLGSKSSSSLDVNLPLKGEVLAEVRFDLPKCYRFHKEKTVDIAVDFWHFEKNA